MDKSFLLVPSEEIAKIHAQLAEIKELLIQKEKKSENILGDWISQKEAMELLGKKYTSLYKLRVSGQLISTKSRPIFYSKKSVTEYLNSMKA